MHDDALSTHPYRAMRTACALVLVRYTEHTVDLLKVAQGTLTQCLMLNCRVAWCVWPCVAHVI